jgi:hypothetical protein
MTVTGDSLADIVARSPTLHMLRRGQLSEFVLAQPSLEDVELAWLLRVDPAGGPENGEDWDERDIDGWLEIDDRLEDRSYGRWAVVGDKLITAVRGGRAGRTCSVTMWDEDVPVLLRPVAESTWFSESGGAPISWDGANEIGWLAPGILAEKQSGDMGYEFKIHERTRRELSTLVAEWTDRIDGGVVAALAYEPFDPRQVLREDERLAFRSCLEHLTFSYSLNMTDEDVGRTRAALRRHCHKYRLTRDALIHPRSRHGQDLRRAVRAAATSGFTGDLVNGHWDAYAESDDPEIDEIPVAPAMVAKPRWRSAAALVRVLREEYREPELTTHVVPLVNHWLSAGFGVAAYESRDGRKRQFLSFGAEDAWIKVKEAPPELHGGGYVLIGTYRGSGIAL